MTEGRATATVSKLSPQIFETYFNVWTYRPLQVVAIVGQCKVQALRISKLEGGLYIDAFLYADFTQCTVTWICGP